MSARPASGDRPNVPLLHDPRFRGLVWQLGLSLVVVVLVYLAVDNAATNMRARGIPTNFDFWDRTSGFDVNLTLISYSAVSTYGRAFWVGLLNTLLVAGVGVVLTTVLGFALGVMRLSSNWVLRKFATIYVETLRNVPLLLQLLFWYNAILSPLPGPRASLALPGLSLGWPGVPVLCVALVAGVAAVVLSRLGKRAQPASALAVTAPICVPLLAFISLAVLLGGFGLVGGIADAGLLRWGAPAGVYLNNRGLYIPEAHLEPGATGVGVALVFAVLAAIAYGVWARRRQAQTGAQSPTVLVGLGLVIMLPLLAFFALGRPIALDYPVLRGFNFQGGLRVLPEFVALVLGLVLYTATFIGEIVRAGIQSVARGQSEAAHALGLRPGATLRLVVIPQAMRVIVPPLTNQYLNLTKNSSLAVFVGYPDLVQVFAGTVLNQTGAAVQVIAITMAVYLVISLATSWLMDLYNRRMALQER